MLRVRDGFYVIIHTRATDEHAPLGRTDVCGRRRCKRRFKERFEERLLNNDRCTQMPQMKRSDVEI